MTPSTGGVLAGPGAGRRGGREPFISWRGRRSLLTSTLRWWGQPSGVAPPLRSVVRRGLRNALPGHGVVHPTPYYALVTGPFGHPPDLSLDLDMKHDFSERPGRQRVDATQRPGARDATVEVALTTADGMKALRPGRGSPPPLFWYGKQDPTEVLGLPPAAGARRGPRSTTFMSRRGSALWGWLRNLSAVAPTATVAGAFSSSRGEPGTRERRTRCLLVAS